MMPSVSLPRFALAFSILTVACWAQSDPAQYPDCPQPGAKCAAYGVDFQGGNSYFQNTASPDAFDFTSQFDQCQNDVAQNLLVDPNGDEYLCSNTTLQPFNVNAKSRCDKQKSDMFDGGWAMLIISNNGKCAPIAYERDVAISAAPQQTTTSTPTVVFSSTSTVFTNSSTTTTITSTITAPPPYTITKPASFFTSTTTITPRPVTTTKYIPVTKTIIRWTFVVVPTTKTRTASCTRSKRARLADPVATVTPSLVAAAALDTIAAEATAAVTGAAGAVIGRAVPLDQEQRLRERKARLARFGRLGKRAPDLATITVTDNNPDHFVTSTTVITTTMTNTIEVDTTVSTTTTPPPATVYTGVSTVPVTTTLLPRTRTRTRTTITYTKVTSTITAHPVVYTTITPSSMVVACTKAGGRIVR